MNIFFLPLDKKPSKICSDLLDRQNIHDKLKVCIDPLDPDYHPNGLVNIVTSRVVPINVSVGQSVEIGNVQMKGVGQVVFMIPLSKKVVNMSVTRKSLKVGSTPIDTIIYSRVLVLQQSRNIDLNKVLQYELAPLPTSMFDDDEHQSKNQHC